jgi:hypothetical protein
VAIAVSVEDRVVIHGSLPVKSAPSVKSALSRARQGLAVKACLYKGCYG